MAKRCVTVRYFRSDKSTNYENPDSPPAMECGIPVRELWQVYSAVRRVQ